MSGVFLADTHTLLRSTGDPGRLSVTARGILSDGDARILVSHATLWELSIKVTVGKLDLPSGFFDALPELGFEMLPMRDTHFRAYRELPLLHRNPFDRMLVAQAQVEGIPILGTDSEIVRYEVRSIW